MATQKRPKLSRAEQKARRPGEILEAAFDEFAEKGFAATRVEDVAARIGVTKGTVYVYFPTKEILFEEAFRYVAVAFADLRREIERLDGDYADRLQNVIRLGYRKLSDDRRVRELLRLSLADGIRFPEMVLRHHDEFIAPLVTAIRTVVAEGVQAGELEGAAVLAMPDVVASSILHLSMWRSLFMDQRPLDEATFIAAHLELVRRALRPVAA